MKNKKAIIKEIISWIIAFGMIFVTYIMLENGITDGRLFIIPIAAIAYLIVETLGEMIG